MTLIIIVIGQKQQYAKKCDDTIKERMRRYASSDVVFKNMFVGVCPSQYYYWMTYLIISSGTVLLYSHLHYSEFCTFMSIIFVV